MHTKIIQAVKALYKEEVRAVQRIIRNISKQVNFVGLQ